MDNSDNQIPKNPTTHLHIVNLMVALIAGVISIVGGVYSLRANIFSNAPGIVQGVVLDEKIGKPLWRAPVELLDSDNSLIGTTDTDENGRYSFKDLKKGNYTVKVSAPLHAAQTKNVKIEPKKTSAITFDLEPSPSESSASSSPETSQLRTIAAPYNPAPSGPNQWQGNQSSVPSPRRRFHHRYQQPPQRQQAAPNFDPSTSAPQNTGSTESSTSTSSSPSSTLTQTGVQLLEDWLSKKSENKTTQ